MEGVRALDFDEVDALADGCLRHDEGPRVVDQVQAVCEFQ